jgi:hypothetical protein
MMASPEGTTAPNSPASEHLSNDATLADSVRPRPTCKECLELFRTLSSEGEDEWPPAQNLKLPCHGWPALTNIMFENPGLESFQAFRGLHIKSLLYYQTQLEKIQQELHKLEWEDHNNRTFRLHDKLSKRADFLFKTETNFGPNDEGSRQILKVKEMRTVLKEYSE